MTFKEKLIRLRKIKGLTQDEFASAVGVSRQAVYKWESGQSYPEVAKLLEIKLLFGISIDDLLDDNFEVLLPEKKKKKRTEAPKAQETEAAQAPVVSEVSEEPAKEEEKLEVKEDVTEEVLVSPAAENTAEEQPSQAEDTTSQEVSESDTTDEEGKKKVGFFGRLFGKK